MKKLLLIGFLFTFLTTLNAKEKEVVGEYISYKVLPVGYELSLKIDGKEKVFFTFQVNEEVLEKHKNEFVRIKLYDEVLKNVYFNNGNTAIEEYDFSTDMDANEKACNNGNAQKCYELAQENAGFLEATGYYNTACEGGHAKACYELANIYELGNRAVEKDVELSKKFYRMACEGGYSDACRVVKKLAKNLGAKGSAFYNMLNASLPRLKGVKPIHSKSNVLVADNSAQCILVGKIALNPTRVIKVPISERIAWGKAPLSGMTKSVIYLDNKSFFFKKAHYDDGIKYIDEYEATRNQYTFNLWRLSGGSRTFFIIPGEATKKFILECYYSR